MNILDENSAGGAVDIYYEDIGSGDPPIVFVHGLGADHVEFDHQLEYLSKRHRCIAFDQRGFGLSPSSGELSVRRSVDDLSELVDLLGLKRFILVGHSMGSMVSYGYTLSNPERVEKLIIIGGTASIRLSPAIYAGMLAVPYVGPYLTDAQRRWLVKKLAFNVSTAGHKASERILQHYFRDDMGMFTGDYYRACLKYIKHITRFDFRRRLRHIRCPVLIVHGVLDLSLPLISAIEARMTLPHASLRLVRGCGHSPNVEEPEYINRLIENFIEAPKD